MRDEDYLSEGELLVVDGLFIGNSLTIDVAADRGMYYVVVNPSSVGSELGPPTMTT